MKSEIIELLYFCDFQRGGGAMAWYPLNTLLAAL